MGDHKHHSESSAQHKHLADDGQPVRIALVTVSDSRTPETDKNYHYFQAQAEGGMFSLVDYRIIKDEPDQVAAALEELSAGEAQLLFFNGGTGISKRDRTYDVLAKHLEKTLPGFGEIFRMLSYEQVGSAAMFSRATAGVYQGKVVVSTPGSPAAVQLAWEKLIAPEMKHLVWEIGR
ncbi:MAG: molybdenum cofactor biosynthesis protein B [Anaerolineaceae bacterium]|jgi:molybdenum cofactor biosynthesis protein B|nr:molybdenum cofactor biosynthesis protein B [Anaerolineaceae bacterium]